MGIINRDLSRSQKRQDETVTFGALATGVTALLKVLEYDATIDGVNVSAFGLSGSPVWSLSAFRFNATGGLTSIGLGSTITVSAIGTSGNIGFSLPGAGYSLIAGDVLVLTTGAANTAVATAAVAVTIKALADIRVFQNTVA